MPEIINATKRGMETAGIREEVGKVDERSVEHYINRVIHEMGQKGISVDMNTRQAHRDPAKEAAAAKVIALFEQVKKQLRSARV